jgi:integrase
MAFAPTQLPSGKWQGGFRHPVTRRKVTRTFTYAHEAEAWGITEERHAKAMAAAGPTLVPEAAPAPVVAGPTIHDHGADWLTRKATKVKSTRDGYAWSLRTLDATGMGARLMSEVRPMDVERWQADMVKDNPDLSARTINAHLKVLRMVYRDAVRNGITAGDATTGVALLTEALKADADLSTDAVDRLADAAPTPQVRALILLGADAGLRYSEAAGLSVSAVVSDGTHLYVEVRQVLERTTGTIRPFPKGKRPRRVPVVTDRLVDALAAAVAAAGDDPDALVVTTETGAPLTYDNFRHRVWPRVKRVAGVRLPKGQGIHQLRHHTGTKLARGGMPRHDVAKFLGHADQKTTARYISPTDDGALWAASRAVMGTPPPRPDLRVVASA